MENKQKQSLLIFVNSYAPKMESFIYNHIKKMCDYKEFEITVLCNAYPDKNFTIDKSVNVIHTEVSSKMKRVLLSLGLLFTNPIAFSKLLFFGPNSRNLSLISLAYKLRGKKTDVVHAHFGHNGKLIAELMEANVIKTKLITQFHGLDITSTKCRRNDYYKTLKKQIDIALINSEYSKGKLLELDFPEAKMIKIPVGTDAESFSNKRELKTERPFVITFIGRLIDLKGPQLLPEIAKAIIKYGFDDFKINIVGTGALKEEIIKSSEALHGKINILGYKSPKEVKELLCDTNVVVYPGITDAEGREETQGLIIQEAMFMGLPVVATAVGGVAESIIDGKTGFICKPNDVNQIAQKIVFLANNPEESIKMGSNALAMAKNKYDLTLIVQEYSNLYRRLIVGK